jgi:hypothetical protein
MALTIEYSPQLCTHAYLKRLSICLISEHQLQALVVLDYVRILLVDIVQRVKVHNVPVK